MNSNNKNQNQNQKIDVSLFDKEEIMKRALKYLIIGSIVFATAYFVPENSLHFTEMLFIAISASAAFGLIDLYSPSVCIV